MPNISISIIARIVGNVNADGTVGQRILLKKMYTTTGEVLPFVSARAIKRCIRDELERKGFEIDPFVKAGGSVYNDTGDPVKYVDNDLFGFMRTVSSSKSITRQGPIAFSYFVALRDTPIRAEFGARFPRTTEMENPNPFEVEVADILGRMNVLIYDYIGVFREEELRDDVLRQHRDRLEEIGDTYKLDDSERVERLRAFLEILLTPSYVLPRRTNSFNIPEYKVALIVYSRSVPTPISNYLSMDEEENRLDVERLKSIIDMLRSISGSEDFQRDFQVYLVVYDKSFVRGLEDLDNIEVLEAKDVVSLASTLSEALVGGSTQ